LMHLRGKILDTKYKSHAMSQSIVCLIANYVLGIYSVASTKIEILTF